MKTENVAEIIRPAITGLKDKIEIAFIFGSVATGYDDDEAEKNLVVIGDIDQESVENAVAPSRDKLDKDIITNVFSRSNYIKEFLAGKIFIRKSANAPKIFFVGDDSDLWSLYYDA